MELWIVIAKEMIKYQHPHTQFNQISDHKHDIYLYGKLCTKNKFFTQMLEKEPYKCFIVKEHFFFFFLNFFWLTFCI